MTEQEKTFTLTLAPLDSTHGEEIRAWRNDYRIWQYTRQNDVISDLEQSEWFQRQAKDPTIKMYRLLLSDGENSKAVGVCGFTSIDYRNGRAEFSIYIEPSCQRRGLGRRALGILLDHGFENHGFRLIWGETFDGNPAANMFEGLGFKKEGTRRAFYYKAGRHIDAHLYSILKEEWQAHGKLDSGGSAGPADARVGEQLPDPGPARRPNKRNPPGAVGDSQGVVPKLPAGKAQAKSKKRGGRVGAGAKGKSGAGVARKSALI